jgi:hypothetical protein
MSLDRHIELIAMYNVRHGAFDSYSRPVHESIADDSYSLVFSGTQKEFRLA